MKGKESDGMGLGSRPACLLACVENRIKKPLPSSNVEFVGGDLGSYVVPIPPE